MIAPSGDGPSSGDKKGVATLAPSAPAAIEDDDLPSVSELEKEVEGTQRKGRKSTSPAKKKSKDRRRNFSETSSSDIDDDVELAGDPDEWAKLDKAAAEFHLQDEIARKEKEEDEELDRQERKRNLCVLRYWGPILVLYPLPFAALLTMNIFLGNLVVVWGSNDCQQDLHAFLYGTIAYSYLFMLFYSWLWMSPLQIKKIKTLVIFYGIFAVLASALWGFLGTYMASLVTSSGFHSCRQVSPAAFHYTRFQVVIFWAMVFLYSFFAWKEYHAHHRRASGKEKYPGEDGYKKPDDDGAASPKKKKRGGDRHSAAQEEVSASEATANGEGSGAPAGPQSEEEKKKNAVTQVKEEEDDEHTAEADDGEEESEEDEDEEDEETTKNHDHQQGGDETPGKKENNKKKDDENQQVGARKKKEELEGAGAGAAAGDSSRPNKNDEKKKEDNEHEEKKHNSNDGDEKKKKNAEESKAAAPADSNKK